MSRTDNPRHMVGSSNTAARQDPGASWAHVTGTFKAIEHRFAVRSTHVGIGRFVEEMFDPFGVAGEEPITWYSIIDSPPGPGRHALDVDEARVVEGAKASRVLDYLIQHVNRAAIRSGDDRVLVHAAAAELDGVGVLLPADMEAGKTTLVAGLVKAGFGYLTDEAAVIDPESLQLHPYPKPLSIDPGSWSVLADLAPRVDSSTRPYFEEQWQVPATRISPTAISGRADAALVIFPRYTSGVETRVEPVSKSQAMLILLEQTFRFHSAGRRNLEVLARFLEGVRCYRLEGGDLGESCRAVTQLANEARTSRGSRSAAT